MDSTAVFGGVARVVRIHAFDEDDPTAWRGRLRTHAATKCSTRYPATNTLDHLSRPQSTRICIPAAAGTIRSWLAGGTVTAAAAGR